MTNKVMLSEREAAQRYPYSVHWFRRARWMGNGPSFIKVGRRIMYPLSELDQWFNQFKRCKSTSEYSS